MDSNDNQNKDDSQKQQEQQPQNSNGNNDQNIYNKTQEALSKVLSETEKISDNLTLLLGEEKHHKYTKEKLKTLHDEINNQLKSPDKIVLENIKHIAFFRETKNSKLFQELKNFCSKFNTKEALESHFNSLIDEASNNLTEENLKSLRQGNRSIRMLKFSEGAKASYIGETKKPQEYHLPAVMEGFGLFKNEETKEFFLGFLANDNFHKGIFVKEKKYYLIGEFQYKSEVKKNEKTSFSGLMVNVADDGSLYFLLGDLSFANSTFEGISIKNNAKEKEIQFDAGCFKEGKKNSEDFYTVKFFLDDTGNISNFKIVYADYENDELKSEGFIQDEFSLIRMKGQETKFYSELSYDGALIFRGDFKVADLNDIVPIFDGEGILLDCESGIKYSGLFKDGKKHGKGVLYMEYQSEAENDNKDKKNISQRILEGEFDNDNFVKGDVKEDGRLIIEEGDFDENLILKRGKVYYENNEFYNGEFTDNKRNGKGTYRYENKYEYHGDWKNGQRDGQGTLFLEEREKQITGEWSENKLIKVTDTTLDKTQ